MSRKKASALQWNHMTDTRAEILEAYFSLYQTREPTTIGSGEILHWFRERQRTAPSEALIRTLLVEIQAPRRGGGRPAHDTAPVETLPPPFACGPSGPAAPPPLAAHPAGPW